MRPEIPHAAVDLGCLRKSVAQLGLREDPPTPTSVTSHSAQRTIVPCLLSLQDGMSLFMEILPVANDLRRKSLLPGWH
ncbi:hypothetical protein RGF97_21245 [Streptomyces roseicoloratus]|uniref:Uncharacterized protein n=1 Tax=Streptomyces roseicoloratus TaxID=2508722 RepID=A0ABY9S072_9ACTN|nr:hypothetical protein [Streptomyces roseicoloratus]WMX46844.1 hypothetical protein RGF97_21245 [Streptomyces roseicoloratus]